MDRKEKIWLGDLMNEAYTLHQQKGLEDSLNWLRERFENDPFDIDALMAYRDILDNNNLDSKVKKAEIGVHDVCAKIIRKKKNFPPRLVAKAYAFRAELSSLYPDRKKYANQALDLLSKEEVRNEEVIYLIELSKDAIDGHGRPITLWPGDISNKYLSISRKLEDQVLCY